MAGEHDELGAASRGVSNRIEGSTLHGPALQAGTMYVSFGGDSSGGDAASAPPPLAPPPAPAPGFVGRDRELRDLLDALTPRAEQPDTDDPTTTTSTTTDTATATAAVLVLGMGGVGKTTLALTAARKALASGLADGVLFLDLAGYDDTAVSAAEVLDALLRDLGVSPDRIPADEQARAALYRARLADRARRGERLLVIADNAADARQVRPLHPPADGPHRLLVTSRDHLPIDARVVDLDVLPDGPAVALLEAALAVELPQDRRITDDPAGTGRVAALCGYLPLALRIAAAQFVADRSLQPAQLADELTDLRERLDVLEDGQRAVRSVLDSSYRRLAPAHRELFLLLSVNPGPDLSAEAATVLAERTAPPRVRRGLATLARASLVRADPETGRWRMHDLVRAYAAEQSGLTAEQREAALDRLLDHYTAGAQDANVQLSPEAPGDPTRFRDRRRALSWLDAEHANLIAAVQSARSARRSRVGVELPAHLKRYLTLRNRTEELTTVMGVALDAALSCGDRIGEARAWNDLGNALSKLDPAGAADAYRTSIARYQELGIRHGAAVARHNLTTLPSRVGRLEDAERFEETAATHRSLRTTFLALGDRPGVASCDLTVGLCLYRLGRHEEALESTRLALTGFQESGDRAGEADTWGNLGIVLNGSGRATEAVAAFRTAVDMYRDLDDRHSTATAHINLAAGLLAVGEPADAVEAGRRAVDLFRALNMTHEEGAALEQLARCLRSAGGPDAERRSVCEAAAAVYRRFGDEAAAERVLGLLP